VAPAAPTGAGRKTGDRDPKALVLETNSAVAS
jgi:hypothetical protein